MALAMYAVRVWQWRRRPSQFISHRKRAQPFLLTFYGDFSVAGGCRCESAETLFATSPKFQKSQLSSLFTSSVVLCCFVSAVSGPVLASGSEKHQQQQPRHLDRTSLSSALKSAAIILSTGCVKNVIPNTIQCQSILTMKHMNTLHGINVWIDPVPSVSVVSAAVAGSSGFSAETEMCLSAPPPCFFPLLPIHIRTYTQTDETAPPHRLLTLIEQRSTSAGGQKFS